MPADIPDKYLDYFGFFFDPQYNMDNDDVNNGYDNTEDILKSSRPSISSKDSDEFDAENEEEEEKEKNLQMLTKIKKEMDKKMKKKRLIMWICVVNQLILKANFWIL